MTTPARKNASSLLKDSGPATLIKAELERIIQGSSSRKNSKLHQDCRGLIEFFEALPQQPIPTPHKGSATPRSPTAVAAKTVDSAANTVGESSERPSSGLTPVPIPEGAPDPEAPAPDGTALVPEQMQRSGTASESEGTALPPQQTQRSDTAPNPDGTAMLPKQMQRSDSEVEAEVAEVLHAPHAVLGSKPVKVQLTDEQAWKLLAVLHAAIETRLPRVVEVVQDCLQRLVAHGHICGVADAMASPDPLPPPKGADELLSPTESQQRAAPAGIAGIPTVAAMVIDLMCSGVELADESVELQVLKGMLTTVSCTSFQVHGEALLRVVRTCYNIFLASKSEVNQTTAKACLTQMLTLVFQRMESDSCSVPMAPIVVADLLRPTGEELSNPMMQVVQTFLNKVMTDLEHLYVATYAIPSTFVDNVQHEFDGERFHDKDGPLDSALGLSEHCLTLHQSSDSVDQPTIFTKAGFVAGSVAGSADGGEQTTPRTVLLRRDAFLVFRALCKLSMKNPAGGTVDPFQARGKLLSLELVKILLDNSGSVFHTSPKFIGSIKQYLCMSLLKNCSQPSPQSFQLSVGIFGTLLSRFRDPLKAEIGVFFPMMLLRVLESSSSSFAAVSCVLRGLKCHCSDAQLLVDLFVNYDCDLEGSNLFERTVNTLVKVAQRSASGYEEGLMTVAQTAALRLDALQCLVCMLSSLASWIDNADSATTDTTPLSTAPAIAAAPDGDRESLDAPVVGWPVGAQGTHFEKMKSHKLEFEEQRKASKLELEEAVALFNQKPMKGIKLLQKQGKLSEKPADVAEFLMDTTLLDRTMIGEFLGERADFNLAVMHAYVDSKDFGGMEFDEAIRSFLSGFRLPGEAQKIDRLMEKFAERFCVLNPKQFKNAETAYVLAYSVIMLNTDAHNPQVKNKMKKDQFVRNNRGIDDGKDIDKAFMEALYDRIVNNEIRMETAADALKAKAADKSSMSGAQAAATQAARIGLDLLMNLLPGRRQGGGPEVSENEFKSMQEKLRAKAGKAGAQFVAATASECVRPMLEVAWPPMLVCFSVPMEDSDEPHTIQLCLDGFRYIVHISACLSQSMIRDAFVTSLCKFTHLHAPASMQAKHVEAIKVLAAVAEEDGNNLQDSWVHVLKCVSRFDLVCQLSSGVMTDATIFAQHPEHPPPPCSTRAGAYSGARPAASSTSSLATGSHARTQSPGPRASRPARPPTDGCAGRRTSGTARTSSATAAPMATPRNPPACRRRRRRAAR